jgi:hypothetical protein
MLLYRRTGNAVVKAALEIALDKGPATRTGVCRYSDNPLTSRLTFDGGLLSEELFKIFGTGRSFFRKRLGDRLASTHLGINNRVGRLFAWLGESYGRYHSTQIGRWG